jgi:hypothetical protein
MKRKLTPGGGRASAHSYGQGRTKNETYQIPEKRMCSSNSRIDDFTELARKIFLYLK